MLKKMTDFKLKKLIRKATEKAAYKFLHRKQEGHSKTKDIDYNKTKGQ